MKATSAETVGLVLLGVSVISLGLLLHEAQPGMLGGTTLGWIWPVGAALIYVAVALLHAGLKPAAGYTFLVCAGSHIILALLMGLGFIAQSTRESFTVLDALAAGLWLYPPAVLLQVAFCIPLAVCLVPGRKNVADKLTSYESVTRATTPEQLVQALVGLQSAQPVDTDLVLLQVITQAAKILPASINEMPKMTGTDETEPASVPEMITPDETLTDEKPVSGTVILTPEMQNSSE